MTTTNDNVAHISSTKPHYLILDGLRGVAALIVLLYHIGEGFGDEMGVPVVNHGYLGVDFFFILSGFVLGYAYDDRWQRGLSTWKFVRRRIIRLHPMLIIGALLGVATFLIQGSVRWDGGKVSIAMVSLALFLQLLMIPLTPGSMADVRGNTEMFPLNGPSWSLFFEYVASFFYAVVARKFSTPIPTAVVVLLGALLAGFTITDVTQSGIIGFGWSMMNYGFWGGLLKVLFSFSLGLLLSRRFRPRRVRGAFGICAAVLLCIALMPNMANYGPTWMNTLFDVLCVLFVFPILIIIGASAETTNRRATAVSTFLGKISYPVYIIHYPFYYLLYAWLWSAERSVGSIIPVAVGLVSGCILLSYLLMKYYDEPVRRYLSQR